MECHLSVSLDDHLADFIATQLAQGHYGSASDVVRAGLRSLEEHEARLQSLRHKLIDGDPVGPHLP
jgi:antitoxin ParD1/3/4